MKAQRWVRHYNYPVLRWTVDLLQYPNGDYFIADNHSFVTGATSTIYNKVSRVDPYGDTLWTRQLATYFAHPYLQDAAMDAQNGTITVGARFDTTGPMRVTAYHINNNGTTDWETQYMGGYGLSVIRASNGDFIIGAVEDAAQTGPANNHFLLLRTDSMGNLLWSQTLPFIGGWHQGISTPPGRLRVIEDANQDLFVLGQSDSLGFDHGTFLMKTNAAGVPQWTIRYWEPPYNNAFWAMDMCRTPNGGFAFVGKDSMDLNIFMLTDSLGDIVHTHRENAYDIGTYVLSSIIPTHEGGYFIGNGNSCIKTDAQGNSQWVRIPQNANYTYPALLEDADNFLLMYFSHWESGMVQGSGLARYDSSGHLYDNIIRGNIYSDNNLNCIADSGDVPVQGWVVRALPGNQMTATDTLGNYELDVDTGTYVISASHPSPFWNSICPSLGQWTHSFTTSPDTVDSLDFAFELLHCAVLEVELANNLLRRCSTSIYSVNYWNRGLDFATNTTVRIVMDPNLTMNSASIPWTLPQVGDTFDFAVGLLPAQSSGAFYFTVTVTCDTSLINATHCVSAHIFPDTTCLPIDPLWDLSSIAVQGTCENEDTVAFRIINEGLGNMSSHGGLVILEDDIMSMTGTFDLASMQDTVIKIPANGKTWALLAQQSPGHPGRSQPRAFIEGCGTLSTGGFSTGHVTTQAQDEADLFLAIECDQNIGSCDPNMKEVSPEGIGANHYIAATDQLQYTIHFQNTGNDTCFKVVIRDQLDPRLNPMTFHPGPSSHPYTWQIHNQGELEFTFLPIFLPDSNINEPASHGFVSYTIEQMDSNSVGTVIENFADIYFDYNPLVRTNTVFDEIASLPWSYLTYTIDQKDRPAPTVKVWPNPFTQSATIDLGEEPYRNLHFELRNMEGRLMQTQVLRATDTIELKADGLPAGLYIFRVVADGRTITGKVLLMR